MFVLMSSRSSSKLGRLVSKTRSPGQISRKLCYYHFELWSECLPWSFLDQALKVLYCSGERYRAIMALLLFFFFRFSLLKQMLLGLIWIAKAIQMSTNSIMLKVEAIQMCTTNTYVKSLWRLIDKSAQALIRRLQTSLIVGHVLVGACAVIRLHMVCLSNTQCHVHVCHYVLSHKRNCI